MFLTAFSLSFAFFGQSTASQVAEGYRDLLQKSTTVSGSYHMVLTKGGVERSGTIQFVANRQGQLHQLSSNFEELFDGNRHYVINRTDGTYTVRDKRIWGAPVIPGLEFLVQNRDFATISQGLRLNSAANSQFNGAPAVQILGQSQQIWISPSSSRPLGFTYESGDGQTTTGTFSNLKFDEPVDGSRFTFVPKAGTRQLPIRTSDLIAPGATLPAAGSKLVQDRLDTLLKNHDHVVLVFAQKNNAASIDLAKGLSKLNRSKAATPLAVLNSSGARLTIPSISDAEDRTLAEACGVTVFPTTVVINRSGRVVHSEVGGLEGTLKAFLNDAGIEL